MLLPSLNNSKMKIQVSENCSYLAKLISVNDSEILLIDVTC